MHEELKTSSRSKSCAASLPSINQNQEYFLENFNLETPLLTWKHDTDSGLHTNDQHRPLSPRTVQFNYAYPNPIPLRLRTIGVKMFIVMFPSGY